MTPAGEGAQMGSNNVEITPRAAMSLGLVVTLVAALVATAITWGKMEAQIASKIDISIAERDFVRKQELTEKLDCIDRRLTRIEDKLDRLLANSVPRER